MKKIKLYATSFEIESSDNLYYHDDGVVENIIGHTSELFRKYNITSCNHLLKKVSDSRLPFPAGRTVSFFNQKYNSWKEALDDNAEVNVHTFVLRSDKKTEIYCRGHEEYHLVSDNGGPDPLPKALKTFGINTEGFEQLPEEIKCEASGLYSLLRKYPSDKSPRLRINPNTRMLLQWLEKNGNLRRGI